MDTAQLRAALHSVKAAKERSTPPPTSKFHAYFLECRKDANCKCNMCEASIHATLDLRPSNHLFTPIINNTAESESRDASVTSKLRPKENEWSPFDASATIRTPPQKDQTRFARSVSNSHITTAFQLQQEKRSKVMWQRRGCHLLFLALLLELLAPWCMVILSRPLLTSNYAKHVAEQSMVRNRLADRLDFVELKVSRAVRGKPVFNCTGDSSRWTLVEDGFLVHSFCNIYTSLVESVSVWGYPAKTSGILGRSSVNRSFTVLSGRVLEWREGQLKYATYSAGSSWVLSKWSASAIVLDGNTWILEYKRAVFSEGGLASLSALLHFTRCSLRRMFLNVKASVDTAFLSKNLLHHSILNERNSAAPPT